MVWACIKKFTEWTNLIYLQGFVSERTAAWFQQNLMTPSVNSVEGQTDGVFDRFLETVNWSLCSNHCPALTSVLMHPHRLPWPIVHKHCKTFQRTDGCRIECFMTLQNFFLKTVIWLEWQLSILWTVEQIRASYWNGVTTWPAWRSELDTDTHTHKHFSRFQCCSCVILAELQLIN